MAKKIIIFSILITLLLSIPIGFAIWRISLDTPSAEVKEKKFTVTLNDGSNVEKVYTELDYNSYIELPKLDDKEEEFFYGWTEVEDDYSTIITDSEVLIKDLVSQSDLNSSDAVIDLDLYSYFSSDIKDGYVRINIYQGNASNLVKKFLFRTDTNLILFNLIANDNISYTIKNADSIYCYNDNDSLGYYVDLNFNYYINFTNLKFKIGNQDKTLDDLDKTIDLWLNSFKYTVSFDANGGTGSMESQEFTYGLTSTLRTNTFERVGYTFAGWATSSNGTKAYDDGFKTNFGDNPQDLSNVPNANITLYALWTPKTYAITNSTTYANIVVANQGTYNTALSIDISSENANGYNYSNPQIKVYAGTNSSGTLLHTENNNHYEYLMNGAYYENIYITGSYTKTPINYELNYELNGGTVSVANPSSYNIESAAITLNNPTKDYYEFNGWTGTDVNNITSSVIIPSGSTGNRSFEAHYTPINYSITYHNEEGATNSNPTTYNIESDTIWLVDLSRDGYSFDGWYTNIGLTSNATPIYKGSHGNIDLYAKWTPIDYTAEFYDGDIQLSEAQYTLATPFSIPVEEKDGYAFQSWQIFETSESTQWTLDDTIGYVWDTTVNSSNYVANKYYYLLNGEYILATGSFDNNIHYYKMDESKVAGKYGGVKFRAVWKVMLDNTTRISVANISNRDYNGSEQTISSIIITDQNIAIGSTNYTLSNNSATNAGTYTLTISANNSSSNYAGSTTATFTINRINMSNILLLSSYEYGFNYDGDSHLPTITLKGVNNSTIVLGTDYTLTGNIAQSDAGKYTITATGIGNYKGTLSDDFYIYAKLNYQGNTGTGSMSPSYAERNTSLTLSSNTFKKLGYSFTGWSTSSSSTVPTYLNNGSIIMNFNEGTIYAIWNANSYQIIFNGNGNTSGQTASMNMTYDSEATLTANGFSRIGYNFTKWNAYVMTKDSTFANGKNYYTLTNNNYVLASVTVGNTVTEETYYEYDEFLDEAQVNNLTSIQGAEIVFIAYWTPKTYEITLTNNNATVTGSTAVTATYDSNTLSSSITNPQRTGYTFVGWYSSTTNDAVEVIDASGHLNSDVIGYTNSDAEWVLDSTAILYAKWQPNEYTIQFNANGGTLNTTQVVATYDDNQLNPIDITIPEKTGYEFTGWYLSTANDSAKLISQDGSLIASVSGYTDGEARWVRTSGVTLYAHWTPKTYTITLSQVGATTEGTASVTATYDSNVLSSSITNPQRTGYTFDGWYDSNDNNAVLIINTGGNLEASKSGFTNSNREWIRDARATLYAHWTANTYTITLTNTDATTSGSTSTTATYDSATLTAITNPQRTGYDFAGWFDSSNTKVINEGGQLIASAGSYTNSNGEWINDAPLTLYAHWTAKTYTVTLSQEDATNQGATSVLVTYASNTISTFDKPTRVGYTFAGWYTLSSGGSLVIDTSCLLQASVTNYTDASANWIWACEVSGNVTLYAHWTANTYTITLTNKDATVTGSTSVVATYDSSTLATIAAPSRTGYIFTGWFTEENGGYLVITNLGAFNSGISGFTDSNGRWVRDGVATLTAQWQAKEFEITLDKNGGNSLNASKVKVTYDSDSVVIVGNNSSIIPNRSGYTFTGFYLSSSNDSTDMLITPTKSLVADVSGYTNNYGIWKRDCDVSGAVTVYAHWTANDYNVTLDANGGSEDGMVTMTYDSNTHTIISNPIYYGHTLTGWYTSTENNALKVMEANGTLVANVTDYTDASGNWKRISATTLYAKWELSTYDIIFIVSLDPSDLADLMAALASESADLSSVTAIESVTVTYSELINSSLVPNAPALTDIDSNLQDYVFEGWYIGSINETTNEIIYGNMLVNTSKSLVPSVPTGELDENDSPIYYSDANSRWSYELNDILMLYPKYSYTMTLDSNGGSGGSNSFVTYFDTHIISSITNPTRTGYTFRGWENIAHTLIVDENGSLIANVTGYTNENGLWVYADGLVKAYLPQAYASAYSILYARWEANTYGVTYMTPNDTVYPSGDPASTYTYGVGLTLPNNITREHYVFDGWYLEFNYETPVTAISTTDIGDKIVYAKWTAETYQVTFDSHGGSSIDGSPYSVTYLGTIEAPSDPTKAGSTFAGWYLEDTYENLYDFNSEVTESFTLHAKWE